MINHTVTETPADSWRLVFWLILSGGIQDSYTFCVRDHVLSNAQTGNVVFLGHYLFLGDINGSLRYLLPIIVYGFGLFFAARLQNLWEKHQLIDWRRNILLLEIACLFIVGLLPYSLNHLANILVSFSCGLQDHCFTKLNNYNYMSTTCTGNIKRSVDALERYLVSQNEQDLHVAAQFFFIVIIFALGSGIGYWSSSYFGTYAIWLSCLLLCICRHEVKNIKK